VQCFLEAGDGFCKLEYKNDDLSDLVISLDRSKILTAGRNGTFCAPFSSSGPVRHRASADR
jgi:hypothetical protein